MAQEQYLQALQRAARPVKAVHELEPLVQRLSQARIVMLGECSHGSHELYEWRRLISEWLIVKHGFKFIAVEGDWPPCRSLDQYIKMQSEDTSARKALEAFRRWPTWMWANTETARLGEWLRSHNERASREPDDRRVGFYGLDVYSLFESIDEVLKTLRRVNPILERRARVLYSCFDRFNRNEKHYARSLFESPEGCQAEVLSALQHLLTERDLDLQQNARVVKNAEDYYRTMIQGNEDSWNVRDRHMLETLEYLLAQHSRPGDPAKAIVWAHNTHIGDHRATPMYAEGLVNIGGLARERFGPENVALLGLGTDRGTVTASHSWDGPIEALEIPPGRSGSFEEICHQVAQNLGSEVFFRIFADSERKPDNILTKTIKHRAIGVVYDPKHERMGNYVPSQVSQRYDAYLFVDRTRALTPLIQTFDMREIPETYPVGM